MNWPQAVVAAVSVFSFAVVVIRVIAANERVRKDAIRAAVEKRNPK